MNARKEGLLLVTALVNLEIPSLGMAGLVLVGERGVVQAWLLRLAAVLLLLLPPPPAMMQVKVRMQHCCLPVPYKHTACILICHLCPAFEL